MEMKNVENVISALFSFSLQQGAAVFIVIVCVVFGTYKFATRSVAKPNSETDVVPCWKANGYPRGEWLFSGSCREKQVAIAASLRFETATSGSVMTNETGGPLGSFYIEHELAPNQQVVYTATTETGYKSKSP